MASTGVESGKHYWDVVIVGAGMGGATLGYELARAGMKVLFCEKGLAAGGSRSRGGAYVEDFFPKREVPGPKHADMLKEGGRWWSQVHDVSGKRERRFIPFIGAGTGGSSALYGAVLERLFPADFRPRQNYPEASGADLPEAWPVSYEQMRPYYARAEDLYRVRGERDPLKTDDATPYALGAIAMQPHNRELTNFLQGKGLHPYQVPVACEYRSDCDGCQGILCQKDCKNDSGRICLKDAVERHGAELWDECVVERLEACGDVVTRLHCKRKGEPLIVEAGLFVLAAGALASPALLLRSRSPAWPAGLGNSSGLVGKYLMRHYIDLYAVFTDTLGRGSGIKQVACNDFYQTPAGKFGTIQSFGSMPPAPLIVDGLKDDVGQLFGAAAWGVAAARPILTPMLRRLFDRTTILASVMEDLPFRDNAVSLPDDGAESGAVKINYRLRAGEMARIKAFRQQVAATLSPYRYMFIKQAENNQRIAHVCGTCRFGNDPATSVLDRNNRSHDLANLYVVDASFFPSSGGTNPSLTIAANALRVADSILGRSDEVLE